MLAVLSIAGTPPPDKTGAQGRTGINPVVTPSLYNGVSPAFRDLPAYVPEERGEIEHDLLRVKPNRPVPKNYADVAVQATESALAMPGPIQTFEGMNKSEGCGGCIPPDTNGAVGPTQYMQMVNSAVSVYDKAGTRLMGQPPSMPCGAVYPGPAKTTTKTAIQSSSTTNWLTAGC